MALIKCPECQHEVSEHAVSCPNCGFGIKNLPTNPTPILATKKSNAIPIFLICVFAVAILIAISVISNNAQSLENADFIVRTNDALMDSYGILGGSYDEFIEQSDMHEKYSEILKELTFQRNISIVVIIVSAITVCVCLIIVVNNNKHNKQINPQKE